MPIDSAAAPFMKKDKPKESNPVLWCPLRSCKFNDTFRCKAVSVKMKLFTDGRFKCTTYIKKPKYPKSLDYFGVEFQDEFLGLNKEDKELKNEKNKKGDEKDKVIRICISCNHSETIHNFYKECRYDSYNRKCECQKFK